MLQTASPPPPPPLLTSLPPDPQHGDSGEPPDGGPAPAQPPGAPQGPGLHSRGGRGTGPRETTRPTPAGASSPCVLLLLPSTVFSS